MNKNLQWRDVDRKLVAILRGIKTGNVEDLVSGLIACGFRAIEIPLNSPDPLASIKLAVETAERVLPGQCLIGAGTVLTEGDVQGVKSCGANLVVSPNVNPVVIEAAVAAGMVCLPGVFTATEALLALEKGANGLKIFPASVLGPDGIRAMRAILPAGTSICAVGGVSPENFHDYTNSGITEFGLGSCLFAPSMANDEVLRNGELAVRTYDSLMASIPASG